MWHMSLEIDGIQQVITTTQLYTILQFQKYTLKLMNKTTFQSAIGVINWKQQLQIIGIRKSSLDSLVEA
jgi:hypothetical protein